MNDIKNKKLNKAKENKIDEFYTNEKDVEREVSKYKQYFENKIVYCNCDSEESAFWKVFHKHFLEYKLKKLIATCIHSNQKITYSGGNDKNTSEYTKEKINDGSFSSEDCKEILRVTDIVVTNPPFSLWREFFKLLVKNNKQFLVIGNINAVSYNDVFECIQKNIVWTGYDFNKTYNFYLPDNFEEYSEIKENKKIAKVSGITWYTNLPVVKHEEYVQTNCTYNPEKYPKYVNYDAIEVSKAKDIPMDYKETMGVPISFLGKLNTKQFQLIGHSGKDCKKMSEIAQKGEYMQGGLRPYIEKENGNFKYKRLYDRLFIRSAEK